MGSQDRRKVGDAVYGVLRNVLRLQSGLPSWAERGDYHHAADLLAAYLDNLATPAATPAQALNLPEAVYIDLCQQFGVESTQDIGHALQQPSTVDLRVNTLKCTRARAIKRLKEEGIEAEALPQAAHAIRLDKRVPLAQSATFKDGWIEPQDVGSQALSALLAVEPGHDVIDYCAGAGGKTLALAAFQHNRGRLIACDNDGRRLQRLPQRAQRAGLRGLECVVLDGSERLPKADAVLVDAPCSGTGTYRRHPELRLDAPDYPALAALQGEILQQASRYVRLQGRLLYGTCSLMTCENQGVVDAFLAQNPQFVLLESQRWLPFDCDGFYGALMQRVAE
jgi:16S rRNA (cytosine967-C5)-methyltransferase